MYPTMYSGIRSGLGSYLLLVLSPSGCLGVGVSCRSWNHKLLSEPLECSHFRKSLAVREANIYSQHDLHVLFPDIHRSSKKHLCPCKVCNKYSLLLHLHYYIVLQAACGAATQQTPLNQPTFLWLQQNT